MNINVVFTNTRNRVPKPDPLPEVESSRAEAKAFFSGMWHGLALGFVIGAGVVVVAIKG